MNATQDLVRRRPFNPEKAAYKEFDDDLIRLVKASIMPPEATNSDTYFLLELSARYGLDPFAREIWAAKMKGKTGEAGGVQILVGRDGLLAIAERHPSYRGFRNHVVHENDVFEYDADSREMPDGTFSHVTHKFGLKDRGAIVGAWAEVYRKDRPPTFFFAPIDEYKPTSEAKLKYSPWGSMESVMISKCALATGLRLAFRITGLYIEEEMTQALLSEPQEGVYQGPDFGEDEVLAARLRQLFEVAEETQPGSWLPGKVNMTLANCGSQEDRELLAEYLVGFITEHGGKVPEPPEPDAEIEFPETPRPKEDVENEDVATEDAEFVVVEDGQQPEPETVAGDDTEQGKLI